MEWTKVIDWRRGREMDKLEIYFEGRIGRMLWECKVKGMEIKIWLLIFALSNWLYASVIYWDEEVWEKRRVGSIGLRVLWLFTSSVWLFCNPMDCSSPGSSVHGISQERILEWVAISSFRGAFQPGDRTHIFCISCICRQILYHWATWEALLNVSVLHIVEGSYYLPCVFVLSLT